MRVEGLIKGKTSEFLVKQKKMYFCHSIITKKTTMSPTFKRERGYTFKIYSNEEERIHVHVIKDNEEAKFWLEPQIEVANNYGF